MSTDTPASSQARRCLVSGRVQGVFFRASTAEIATTLGIRGWAANLPDGRVEVVAAGDDRSVAKLVEWLWQGPPAARVDAVSVAVHTAPVPDGFSQR